MLWDSLTTSRTQEGLTSLGAEAADHLPWDKVTDAGRRTARSLRDRGIRPGHHVGLVLANSIPAVAAMAGAWFSGAVVVSLPAPARGISLDRYAAQTADLCVEAEIGLLLVDASLHDVFSESYPVRVVRFEEIFDTADMVDPDPPPDDSVAFVQFSSGTTGGPRGAMLTPRAIEAQLVALADALSVDARRDRLAAWLPLSHDMGLFGCLLLTWYTGMGFALGAPQRFLASPRSWLDDCDTSGATITAIQPSALRLVVTATRRAATLPNVSSLRACVVGGERIPPAALDEAGELLAACGAAPAVLTPAYGLAEATLAVCMAPLNEPPRICALDGPDLWEGRLLEPADEENAVRVVSCGRPLSGFAIGVREPPVGEVLVQAPSLARGYLGDWEATAAAFQGDVLATGDLGFVRDEELYPIVRVDDVLNVGGRRVGVGGVEDELSQHPSLRSGCCAIVDIAGDQRTRYVAVAELAAQAGGQDLRRLAQSLRREALGVAGVPLNECVFLPRGGLPKTPSGKVQRFRVRDLASRSGPDMVRVKLRA